MDWANRDETRIFEANFDKMQLSGGMQDIRQGWQSTFHDLQVAGGGMALVQETANSMDKQLTIEP